MDFDICNAWVSFRCLVLLQGFSRAQQSELSNKVGSHAFLCFCLKVHCKICLLGTGQINNDATKNTALEKQCLNVTNVENVVVASVEISCILI